MTAFSAVSRSLAPLASALLLSGCNDHISPAASTAAPQGAQVVASGYSPRPAAVSVAQMEGAPSPLQGQFMAFFDADAAREDVALTDSAGARYLARGYISAFLVDGGARLTYVWDIYDRNNHRAQRLNDEIALKGAAEDPWALVDSSALSALAARSASELAAYLSNTPEALAAAAQNAAATAQNATDPGQARGAVNATESIAAPADQAAPARQVLSYAPMR